MMSTKGLAQPDVSPCISLPFQHRNLARTHLVKNAGFTNWTNEQTTDGPELRNKESDLKSSRKRFAKWPWLRSKKSSSFREMLSDLHSNIRFGSSYTRIMVYNGHLITATLGSLDFLEIFLRPRLDFWRWPLNFALYDIKYGKFELKARLVFSGEIKGQPGLD